jgi:mitochondrial division protein 1
VPLGRLTRLHNCGAQSLLHNDIAEITAKIEALDGIRNKLEEDLLKLQEDELELDDECK